MPDISTDSSTDSNTDSASVQPSAAPQTSSGGASDGGNATPQAEQPTTNAMGGDEGAPVAPTFIRRRFVYNGVTLPVTSPTASPDHLRQQFATIYPGLLQCEANYGPVANGQQTVTFIKRAGSKS